MRKTIGETISDMKMGHEHRIYYKGLWTSLNKESDGSNIKFKQR